MSAALLFRQYSMPGKEAPNAGVFRDVAICIDWHVKINANQHAFVGYVLIGQAQETQHCFLTLKEGYWKQSGIITPPAGFSLGMAPPL
jgi:hypothetical protein